MAGEPREHLLGAGHLRHAAGMDEARRLHAPQACSGQPQTQLRAHAGLQRHVVILQPVTRTDVAQDRLHRDHATGRFAARAMVGVVADTATGPALLERERELQSWAPR